MQKGKLGAKHFYPHIVWQKSGYGMRSSRWGPKNRSPLGVSAHYRQITHRYPLLVSAHYAHGPRTMAHGPRPRASGSHTTASGSHTRTMAGSLGQLVADHVLQLGGPRPAINGQLGAQAGPWPTASGPRLTASWERAGISSPWHLSGYGPPAGND